MVLANLANILTFLCNGDTSTNFLCRALVYQRLLEYVIMYMSAAFSKFQILTVSV